MKCTCGIKISHKNHCFLCSAPITEKNRKLAYLTKDGQIGSFCQRKYCQRYADCRDKEFGMVEDI